MYRYTEALSGRRCLSLRSALVSQSKAFLGAQHAGAAAKLGSLLEAETWVAAKAGLALFTLFCSQNTLKLLHASDER